MWEHSIDLLWLIVLKNFRGLGVQPPEAVRFLQSKGIKIPKLMLKSIMPIYTIQVL